MEQLVVCLGGGGGLVPALIVATLGDCVGSENVKLSCRRIDALRWSGGVGSGTPRVGLRLAMLVSIGVPCRLGVLNSEKVRARELGSFSIIRLAGGTWV